MRRQRSFWIVQSREARVHAVIVAAVLWTVGVFTVMRPGPVDAFGNLKGGDFIHFYTLGHVAASRDAGDLYDGIALHARQAALLPASADAHYAPVYPPQTSLIFAPFSGEPYLWAALAWAACVIAIYIVCVEAAWTAVAQAVPNGWLVACAAVAFPPFWNLVLNGQTSVVPLIAFTAGGLALMRGHTFCRGTLFWPAGRQAAIRARGCGGIHRHPAGPDRRGDCRRVRGAIPGRVGRLRARCLARLGARRA